MTGDRDSVAPSLEAILGALPEAVVVFDVRGRIVYANERFGALHGYDPNELIGHGIARLTPHVGDQTARIARFFEAPIARDEATAERFVGLHRDGRELQLEATIRPLTADGATFGVLVVRDRTERH